MTTLESCVRKINREAVIDGISEVVCVAMNDGSTPETAASRALMAIPQGYTSEVVFRALDRIVGPQAQVGDVRRAIKAQLEEAYERKRRFEAETAELQRQRSG